LGSDGLYFAPLLPDEEGVTPILKITFEPEVNYPYTLTSVSNPLALMTTRGCFACHTLNNNDGGTIGPVLDREILVPRLQTRLNTEEYRNAMAQVDQLGEEPFISFQAARQAVQQAQGIDKVQLWLEYRLQEPKFDDPRAQMPNLGLSSDEAAIIASYLSGIQGEPSPGPSIFRRFFSRTTDLVQDRLPIATRGNAPNFLAGFFVAGILIGVTGGGFSYWVVRVLWRKRHRGSES
jgi:mono/diheme cytochrome c family protein